MSTFKKIALKLSSLFTRAERENKQQEVTTNETKSTQPKVKEQVVGGTRSPNKDRLGVSHKNRVFWAVKHKINRELSIKCGFAGYKKKVRWLIKGVLPKRGVGVVYGPSGSYKSFLVLSWALHIATGRAWSGRAASKGAVLYIAAEGEGGIPRRVKGWCELYNNGEDVKDFKRIETAVPVVEEAYAQELVRLIKNEEASSMKKFELLIIDTMSRCFGSYDENNSTDMGNFISACEYIRNETGIAILIVHHSGKDETRGARGSSTLKTNIEFEYTTSRVKSDDGPTIKLTNGKAKDDEALSDSYFHLEEHHLYVDEDGDSVSTLVLRDKAIALKKKEPSIGDKALKVMLSEDRPFSLDELLTLVNIDSTKEIRRESLQKSLKRLECAPKISIDETRNYILAQ